MIGWLTCIFVSMISGFAGRDDFESAQIDAVVDTMLDIQTGYMPIMREKDETKKVTNP